MFDLLTIKVITVIAIALTYLLFDIVGKRHSRFEIARQADPRTMAKVAFFYRKLIDVLPDDYRFFMVRKRGSDNLKGIPLLTQKEIAKAKTEGELIDLILERMK